MQKREKIGVCVGCGWINLPHALCVGERARERERGIQQQTPPQPRADKSVKNGRTDGASQNQPAARLGCVCVLRRPQKRRMRRISQIEIARRARKKSCGERSERPLVKKSALAVHSHPGCRFYEYAHTVLWFAGCDMLPLLARIFLPWIIRSKTLYACKSKLRICITKSCGSLSNVPVSHCYDTA
jgi:hypothetical protein